MKKRQKRTETRLRLSGWAAALAFLGIGLWSTQGDDDWGLTGAALFSLPLLSRFSRRPLVRVYGLWLGGFLVLQTGVSYFAPDDYKTLPPKLHKVVNVVGDGIRGISGRQTITTDEQGFRSPQPVDYATKRVVRVFAIGASTTEELFLDDHRTWTSLLQDKLAKQLGRPVEVINTGLSGLRARHHLATLKKVLKHEPDLVLFLLGVNDWNHHIELENGSKEPDSAKRAERLRFRNTLLGRVLRALRPDPAVAQALRDMGGETTDDGSFYARMAGSLDRGDRRSFRPERVLPEYDDLLEAMGSRCRAAGVTCVFLTQPNAYRPDVDPALKRRFWMTPPKVGYTLDFDSMVHIAALYNRRLLEFGKERGLPVCDLAQQLTPNFENFWDEVHYNESGARNVSDRILECIASSGWKV